MKQLIRWVMAAAFAIATALPAMAKSWDVCLETADLNTSGEVTVAGISQPEFFATAASIFPSGTFAVAATSKPLTSCKTSASPVGLFLARGSAVGNLPAETARSVPDIWLVEWYFRFQRRGAFSTMGPVTGAASGNIYTQAITGALGGKTTVPGKAVITVLSYAGVDGSTVNAFSITVP
jgi:hypothetical protein